MRRITQTAFCASGALRVFRDLSRRISSQPTMTSSSLCRIAEISRQACARSANSRSPLVWPGATIPPQLTEREMTEITDCVRGVSSSDLRLHRRAFGSIPNEIAYIHVWDSPAAVMAVFVLPPGTRIPLHDHPDMYVFSKILWGELNVESYDVVDCPADGRKTAIRNNDEISKAGEVRVLDPVAGNVHSFQSDRWTAVFDVVLPPYDDRAGRHCTYYKTETLSSRDATVALQAVEPPDDFLMYSLPYTGVRVTV